MKSKKRSRNNLALGGAWLALKQAGFCAIGSITEKGGLLSIGLLPFGLNEEMSIGEGSGAASGGFFGGKEPANGRNNDGKEAGAANDDQPSNEGGQRRGGEVS